MTVVGFLDRCAASDWKSGVVVTDSDDAFVDEIVCSTYPADGVVNLRWAIEGDDDVVEESGDFFRAFVQEKARGQEGEMNLPVAKEVAESGEIVVEQRFTAGENDLLNPKGF